MKLKNLKLRQKYIAVIGDIHGCYNTLFNLYGKLQKFRNNIYSVGDIIDRGKKSRQTLQFIIDKNIKCVKGNHELWLLNAIENKYDITHLRRWLNAGGYATLINYLDVDENLSINDFYDEISKFEHYQFISALPLKYEIDNVIISHAGIINNGDDLSILFNYERPLKIDGKLQIFGHIPYKEIQYIKNWYASIDTGCVFQYKLTAVIVDSVKAEIVDIIESPNSE